MEKAWGNIKKFVTHERPHFDEIVAWFLWSLRFPDTQLLFLKNGNMRMKFGDDTIAIGIGGGEFDEHSTGKGDRKKDQCAATLMAYHLGIEEDPCFKKLLEYTLRNDLKGVNGGILDVAARIKTMYDHMDQMEVVKWALVAINDFYIQQKKFHNNDFDEKAKITVVKHKGKDLKIAAIVSDNTIMSKVARARGVDLLIQQESSGNVQIFSKQGNLLDMGGLARILRVEENRLTGNRVKNDWKLFETEEKINSIPQWYFHKEMGAILNGSKTATGVPPTKLKLAEIQDLTVSLLDDKSWYKACKTLAIQQCKNCKLYDFGYRDCRAQRGPLLEKEKKAMEKKPAVAKLSVVPPAAVPAEKQATAAV